MIHLGVNSAKCGDVYDPWEIFLCFINETVGLKLAQCGKAPSCTWCHVDKSRITLVNLEN